MSVYKVEVRCELSDPILTMSNSRLPPLMSSLRGRQLVHFSIIDAYFRLLQNRSRVFREAYPEVLAISCDWFRQFCVRFLGNQNRGRAAWVYDHLRGKNLYAFDLVFFPILICGHYTLAIFKANSCQILYYDSQGPNFYTTIVFHAVKVFLHKASQLLRGYPWSYDEIRQFEEVVIVDGPNQGDQYNCGVFISRFAEMYSRNDGYQFDPRTSDIYRNIMMYELSVGRVFSGPNVALY